jgi:signal transduction histidine kinase
VDTPSGPPKLQREGLRFFGRIAAGLSHELSNVLNIINELAGLQQDIAGAATDDARGAQGSRIADLAGRIRAQIERAEGLNRRLHAFAHTIDSATVAFELADLLDLLEALAARAARLGQVELRVHRPTTPITLQGDPFALLLSLYAMIELGLAAAASERRLSLDAEPASGGARVTLESADPLPPLEEPGSVAPALEMGRAAWGATITSDEGRETETVVLSLPAIAPTHRSENDAPREGSHET